MPNDSSDQPTPQSTPQPAKRGATPATFGDGSTREQREQLQRDAKEANQQVKDAANAERAARAE